MYTIKEKMLKVFNVETEEDIDRLVHNRSRELFMDLETELFNASNRVKSNIGGYEGMLAVAEEELGTFAGILYMYLHMDDYMYEPVGPYVNLLNCEMMSENFRTSQHDNKMFFVLDIWKRQYTKFIDFLSQNSYPKYDLNKIFESIIIECDERTVIQYGDPEFEDYVKKIEELEDVEFAHDFNTKVLKFSNPRENEPKNLEMIKEFNEATADEFNSKLDELMMGYLRTGLSAALAPKPLKIHLVIGESSRLEFQEGHKKLKNPITFDTRGHPLKAIKRFSESLLTAKEKHYDGIIVATYNEHIVNYIRHLVSKKEAVLLSGKFYYIDEDGDCITMNILEDGSFYPPFPKGFYDASLEMIVELETNLLDKPNSGARPIDFCESCRWIKETMGAMYCTCVNSPRFEDQIKSSDISCDQYQAYRS